MTGKKTYPFLRPLKVLVAVAVAAGVLILSVAAVGSKDKEAIAGVQIKIENHAQQNFIDEDEILSLLKKAAGRQLEGLSAETVDLFSIEKELKKHDWIKKAELFIDNRKVLRVNIEQESPAARIFTDDGKSFFVSDQGAILPMREGLVVRLPIFTGFEGDVYNPAAADSALFVDVIKIARFVQAHDFWMSQIEQIDITPSAQFEMIPKLGNQIIRFGTAEGYEEKFRKLLAFYQQVMVKTGWNRYSVIDLQYAHQVVAERRNAAEIKADSLAAIRIMRSIIEKAKKNADDSTMIQLPERVAPAKVNIRPRETDNSDNTISEVIPEKPLQPEGSEAPIIDRQVRDDEVTERPKAVMAPVTKPMDTREDAAATPSPMRKPEPPVRTVKPAPEAPKQKPEAPKQKAETTKQKPEMKQEKKVPKAVMPAKNNDHD